MEIISKGYLSLLVLDTQSIADNHFSFRRNVSTFFWIHHMIKVPFFCLLYLREMAYSEDGSMSNDFNEDVEETLQLCIVPKRVWKLYDRYCYSVLTDHLPLVTEVKRAPKRKIGRRLDLKARDIISFKKFKTVTVKRGGAVSSEK